MEAVKATVAKGFWVETSFPEQIWMFAGKLCRRNGDNPQKCSIPVDCLPHCWPQTKLTVSVEPQLASIPRDWSELNLISSNIWAWTLEVDLKGMVMQLLEQIWDLYLTAGLKKWGRAEIGSCSGRLEAGDQILARCSAGNWDLYWFPGLSSHLRWPFVWE